MGYRVQRERNEEFGPGSDSGQGAGRVKEEGSTKAIDYRLLIRNLNHTLTHEDLRIELEAFGEVVEVDIPTDFFSGQPRGFGYVTLARLEDAQQAKIEMDGTDLDGRIIEVSFVDERHDSCLYRRSDTERNSGSAIRSMNISSHRQRSRSRSRSPPSPREDIVKPYSRRRDDVRTGSHGGSRTTSYHAQSSNDRNSASRQYSRNRFEEKVRVKKE